MKRLILAVVCTLLIGSTGWAQRRGFALNHYEPTPAGEQSFWVDHPWYDGGHNHVAVGLTLNDAHDPLVLGTPSGSSVSVISNQLIAHFDVAFSLFDRLLLSGSLPVTLYENGVPAAGVAPSGSALGDPRLGAMIRLVGQPMRDAFSLNLGADFWIPAGGADELAGDARVRVMPKLIAAGYSHHVLWSALAAYQYRTQATLGAFTSSVVGQELKTGVAVAYADRERGFSLGPEAMIATNVSGPPSFKKASSSLEVLLGAHYRIMNTVQLGAAIGMGFLGAPGTPEVRVLFRAAYAPRGERRPKDRDGDGIPDRDDACLSTAGVASDDPSVNGCPKRPDRDGDGVVGGSDHCPDQPAGPTPDPQRPGCPMPDSDVCSREATGPRGDSGKKGCPLKDRDGDGVLDADDACPDQSGKVTLEREKNGCPLVEVKEDKIEIRQQLFFSSNSAEILPESIAVLEEVAQAINASPQIQRLSVNGHTDASGNAQRNRTLSLLRAESVRRLLVERGVDAARLEAHGFGGDQPLESNDTPEGRAKNRRVEFLIVEPSRLEHRVP